MISNDILLIFILLSTGFHVKTVIALICNIKNANGNILASQSVIMASNVLMVSIPLELWAIIAYFTRLINP